MKKSNASFITFSALIAALYVILTYISYIFGLSSGVIQCRISEGLCVLAAYTPAAIPGLTIGCLLSNLLLGGVVWDVIFGSLATLLGALIAFQARRFVYLSPVFPIITNTAIVPLVLIYAYNATEAWFIVFGSVFIGEVISCGVFGFLLIFYLEKTKNGRKIKNILQNGKF